MNYVEYHIFPIKSLINVSKLMLDLNKAYVIWKVYEYSTVKVMNPFVSNALFL